MQQKHAPKQQTPPRQETTNRATKSWEVQALEGRLKTKHAKTPHHARLLFSAPHLGQELLLSRERLLLFLEHLHRRGVEAGRKPKRNKQAHR